MQNGTENLEKGKQEEDECKVYISIFLKGKRRVLANKARRVNISRKE